MLVTCLCCSIEFEKDNALIKQSPSHFCSRSCAAKVNNKKAPKRSKEGSCLTCASPIPSSRKYCKGCRPKKPVDPIAVERRKVQARLRAKSWKKNNKVKCLDCDAMIYPSSDRCRSCYRLFQQNNSLIKTMTLAELHERLSTKNKHPSWKNANVRNLCRSWNAELTKLPCFNCGYDKHVELCHRKDVSSFDESATLWEVNCPENVVQLCRNCHWEFDNELLVLT